MHYFLDCFLYTIECQLLFDLVGQLVTNFNQIPASTQQRRESNKKLDHDSNNNRSPGGQRCDPTQHPSDTSRRQEWTQTNRGRR